MSEPASAKLGFPELPKLSDEDLAAMRRFLPGKLLGRLAALLGIVLLVLSSAGAVDLGLRQFFSVDLSNKPWLRGLILFGLPSSVVFAQVVVEWRAARVAEARHRLAISPVAVPAGHFRLCPYENTKADRKDFRRADRAHEDVLDWLKKTEGAPLYLEGQSGCGKSSLLQAFVLPSLRAAGWTIAEARDWRIPEEALREALWKLPGAPSTEAGMPPPQLRELIEGVATQAKVRRAKAGFLLLLDHFENFAVLQPEESRAEFIKLVSSLYERPVPGLRLLLTFRSDYGSAIEKLELPERQSKNWRTVGAFLWQDAAGFLDRAGLGLRPEARDELLASCAELDGLAKLIRPVTLNFVGHVLAKGPERAPSLDAGALIRGYVAQVVGAPELRDEAPKVLKQLLTAQGTKRPRSEAHILENTGFQRYVVRAVLLRLCQAGLARLLDREQGIWELSHDFVAQVVSRHLGQGRRIALRRAAAYAAPALLAATLALGAGAITWERVKEDHAVRLVKEIFEEVNKPLRENENRSPILHPGDPKLSLGEGRAIRILEAFGMTVEEMRNEGGIKNDKGFLRLSGTVAVTDDILKLAAPFLKRLAPRLLHVSLPKSPVTDLHPLSGLTALQSLDLSGTQVTNLAPLAGLPALQNLQAPEGVSPLARRAFNENRRAHGLPPLVAE